MKSLKLSAAVVLGSLLAACGGGGSSSSGPSTITVSGAPTSLAAGQTNQFSANASGVTWEVDGVTGGSATAGTISATGLYTAPALPPDSQPVIVSATANGVTGSASFSVVYAAVSLQGVYVLNASLTDGTNAIALVGRLTADGKGGLTGSVDLNGPGGAVTAAITDSYTVNSDGSGSFTLDCGSAGPFSFDFGLIAGGGTALISSSTYTGKGQMFPIATLPTAPGQLKGNFVFSSNGLPNGGVALNELGQLKFDGGGNITAGDVDSNNLSSPPSHTTGIVGTYTLGANGRGTLSITGTRNYVFYATSVTDLQLVETDSGKVAAGEADLQTSTGVLANTELLAVSNYDAAGHPDALISNVMFTSGSATVVENDNGTVTSANEISSNTVPGSSRGTFTLNTPGGARTFVYYVVTTGELLVQEADSLGDLAGTSTANSALGGPLPGTYLLTGNSLPVNTQKTNSFLAVLSSDTATGTQFTGYEFQNVGGTVTKLNVSGGVSSWSQVVGPAGTLPLNFSGGSQSTTLQVVGGSGLVFVGLGADTSNVSSSSLLLQYANVNTD